jgi:hypothetical protein
MTESIKVYPTKASALNVHHPIAGKPSSDGVDWPYDTFTCRRLMDGSFSDDPAQAFKQVPEITEKFTKPAEPAAAVKPPPPAKND